MGGLAWGTRVEACGGGEAKGHRLRPLIAPQGSGAGTAGDFFPPEPPPTPNPNGRFFAGLSCAHGFSLESGLALRSSGPISAEPRPSQS